MAGSHAETLYMQRCITLAKKGFRHTFTNPMVGCVIVYQNRIIGEGYHQKYGEHHAEVNALNDVIDHDRSLLPHSTMYVSLEPCAHVGKTPACAHRIASEGIKNVVIGCIDPNPVVAGRGISYLKTQGINVTVPILKAECQKLLTKFKANLNGIPYIILKWAKSSDHFISKQNTQTWLTNAYTNILTHKWRSEVEGIMIGKNTALIDNPSLDVRHYSGISPVRILMDTHLSTDQGLKILSDQNPSIVINSIKGLNDKHLSYIKVDNMGDCREVMSKIFNAGISSVLIEGGASLLKSFISSNCWHEARVIDTDLKLMDGIAAPLIEGKLDSVFEIQGDKIMIISNQNSPDTI